MLEPSDETNHVYANVPCDIAIKLIGNSITNYALDRNLTPQQFSDLFSEGIVNVMQSYPESHPLRIAVMKAEPNAQLHPSRQSGAAC